MTRRATHFPPGRATPLLVQADLLVRAGRSPEAIPLLMRAVLAEPGNAAIRHDLATLYLQTGQLAGAIETFQAALGLAPGFAASWLGLGVALQANGDEGGALAAYLEAPSLAEAGFRAGALLESHGRRLDAIRAFQRAARTAPRSSLGRLSEARALLADGRDDDAERALRRLLALDPDHAAASDLLGRVLAEAGKLDEARQCYDRATLAAPHLAGSYYDLVRCRRLTTDDAALLARMRATLDAPLLHPEIRLKLHLALGKAVEDLGDPEAAMRHFDAAHALRQTMARFDAGAFAARIDRIIAECRPICRDVPAGRPSPILIVGLPRSGTTLVEQILSSHSKVAAGGELPFWTERGFLWEQGGHGDPGFLETAATEYRHALGAHAADGWVTDKMPLNLYWAGLVAAALPDAVIVHCSRRPIETALSIHRTYFNQHVAFPTGGEDLVEAIRATGRLAEHWRATLPANRFVEVEYEALVRDPEAAIRRLLLACGLAWEPACLTPERNPRRVRTPSLWQVRQPISDARVDQWRRYGPWLGALGALAPDISAR